jgi:hypothetical protein
MITTTAVTRLSTESMTYPGADNHGDGPSTSDYRVLRPTGVILKNDGGIWYWLVEGYGYDLAHDGTGWRVYRNGGEPYTTGHTHRLATLHGGLTGALPTANGEAVTLDPMRRYRITCEGGSATLTEVD